MHRPGMGTTGADSPSRERVPGGMLVAVEGAMSHGLVFWGFEIEGAPPWEDDWLPYALRRLALEPFPRSPGEAFRRKVAEASGCTVGTFGMPSLKVPCSHFVAIDASVTRTLGCVPIPVTRIGAEWHDRLRAFCAKLGVPWAEPAWTLTVEKDG
jgi:hypothetical protein